MVYMFTTLSINMMTRLRQHYRKRYVLLPNRFGTRDVSNNFYKPEEDAFFSMRLFLLFLHLDPEHVTAVALFPVSARLEQIDARFIGHDLVGGDKFAVDDLIE